MPDYSKLYYVLFNAITDALQHIEAQEVEAARVLLIRAQQETENLFIEAGDEALLSAHDRKR